jgi:NADH-quinone oxidoreductase subunit N
MSTILKLFILLIVFLAFLYSRQYLSDRKLLKGEYLVLGLFATLGMMIMVSANTLLTIYLGLELLSLSLYTMVAMNRDSQQASEAAMKYFVLGALASGMLLYGMQSLHGDWQNILILLSILSMAIGNIIAIAQTNIKRMLAYMY